MNSQSSSSNNLATSATAPSNSTTVTPTLFANNSTTTPTSNTTPSLQKNVDPKYPQFEPFFERDSHNSNFTWEYQSITRSPQFSHFTFDQLRWQYLSKQLKKKSTPSSEETETKQSNVANHSTNETTHSTTSTTLAAENSVTAVANGNASEQQKPISSLVRLFFAAQFEDKVWQQFGSKHYFSLHMDSFRLWKQMIHQYHIIADQWSHFLNQFAFLQNSEEENIIIPTDLTIRIYQQEKQFSISVHGFQLAMRSNWFKRILFGKTDSKTDKKLYEWQQEDRSVLFLGCICNFQILEIILFYLYTDMVTLLPFVSITDKSDSALLSLLQELYNTCTILELHFVKEKVIQWLETSIDISNFIDIWKWISTLENVDPPLLRLKQKCQQLLFDHLLSVSTSQQKNISPKQDWETVLQMENWTELFVTNEWIPTTEHWNTMELKQPKLYHLCCKLLWKWMTQYHSKEWLHSHATLFLQYKLLQLSPSWLECLTQMMELSPHLFIEQVFQ